MGGGALVLPAHFTRSRTRLNASPTPTLNLTTATIATHLPVARAWPTCSQSHSTMPHSTDSKSPAGSPAGSVNDAPSPAGSVKDEPMEDSGIPDSVTVAADGDVAMGEAEAADVKKEVKLDELFADVDSDDEFPSSAPKQEPVSSPPPAPTTFT